MTVLRRLLGERRAITAADFDKAIFAGRETYAGVDVNADTALTYIPVWSCIRLLSETVAGIPVDSFRKKENVTEKVLNQPKWLDRPNPETTKFEYREREMVALNTGGNSYTLVGALDNLGYPTELWNLHPTDMVPGRDGNDNRIFTWKGTKTLYPWNPNRPAAGSVLHVKAFGNGDLGLNPIDAARQGIGIGMAAEEFGARFYGSGQSLSGVIELPEKSVPSADFQKTIRDTWVRKHAGLEKSHLPGLLTGGATWKPISIPPDTAQFLETRQFQKADIATFFRVPPHMIGHVEKTSSWGAGIEQQSIGFVVYSILPWITRLEAAYASLTPRGQYLKWNVSGLLRGDAKSRHEAYAIGVTNGYMTRNEVRELEDMNPLDGLDEPLVPNSNAVPANDGGSDGAQVSS